MLNWWRHADVSFQLLWKLAVVLIGQWCSVISRLFLRRFVETRDCCNKKSKGIIISVVDILVFVDNLIILHFIYTQLFYVVFSLFGRTGKLVWLYFQQRLGFFQKVLSLTSELNVQTRTKGVVEKAVEIVTFYISFTKCCRKLSLSPVSFEGLLINYFCWVSQELKNGAALPTLELNAELNLACPFSISRISEFPVVEMKLLILRTL